MKRLAVICFLSFAFGCSSSDDGQLPADNHASNNDTHNGSDGTVDTYVDGLMKIGDRYHVTLMSADPAPPDVGDNTWTLRITDPDGTPIESAKVTVSPFMPAHGHGTSPADHTALHSSAGEYQVGPIDLFMPGTWETTVKVEGDAEDSVVFSFELEG